jgi:hypothetical protein|tara:strand:- start:59 stop:190 length:132 start_codon:yes stop_codon:yes gene_type:complete
MLLESGVLNHIGDSDNPNLSEEMIEVLKQLGKMKMKDLVNEID